MVLVIKLPILSSILRRYWRIVSLIRRRGRRYWMRLRYCRLGFLLWKLRLMHLILIFTRFVSFCIILSIWKLGVPRERILITRKKLLVWSLPKPGILLKLLSLRRIWYESEYLDLTQPFWQSYRWLAAEIDGSWNQSQYFFGRTQFIIQQTGRWRSKKGVEVLDKKPDNDSS